MDFEPTSLIDAQRTTNYEGGEAFRPATPEMGLYTVVVNNLLEDTYYEDDEEKLLELATRFERAADAVPEFTLKLAAYAREEMGLREVPQVLLVFGAHHENTREHVREYAPRVIARPDELATVVDWHLELFGKPIPKPLKKGVADAFHQFDRYGFAKYSSGSGDVSLVDVMNLVHPRPETPEEEEIFERMALGELDDHPDVDPLEPPRTWEVVISERGSTAEAWRSVLPDMGIFATIRNLRNMLEAGLDGEEILDESDLERADASRLYPFRFYQAAKALEDAGIEDEHVRSWLEAAVDRTATNLPAELSNTFVAVDLSGSMGAALSERSAMTYEEIAALFGAVLADHGGDVSVFASEFDLVTPGARPEREGVVDRVREYVAGDPIDPERYVGMSTLELAAAIRDREVGHATNGWKALRHLVETGVAYDRVVILTDMQVWDSTFGASDEHTVREWYDRYRENVAPAATLYTVDLSSYGDLLTPEGYDGVYHVSGWTDRIVDFIARAERPEEVIEEIRAY